VRILRGLPTVLFASRSEDPSNALPNSIREELVGVSVSILLIAVGAILTWAVTATVSGVSIQTVGVILLIVGIVGLVLSMIFWSSWGGVGGGARRRTYVEEGPPGP
jgi:hypothetical protein